MNTTDQPTPAPEHAPTESDNKLAAQIFGFAHSKDFADGHKIPALIAQHVSAAVATATAELKANRDQWFSNYTESARTLMELRADLATAQRQLVEAEAAAFSVCSTIASQLAASQAALATGKAFYESQNRGWAPTEEALRKSQAAVSGLTYSLEISTTNYASLKAAAKRLRDALREACDILLLKPTTIVLEGKDITREISDANEAKADEWLALLKETAALAPSAGGGGETEKTRLYNELVVPEASRAAAGATPRTDDQILTGTNRLDDGEYVRADFARTLERELTASSAVGQRDYDGMREFQAKFVVASQELTALRAERDALVARVDTLINIGLLVTQHLEEARSIRHCENVKREAAIEAFYSAARKTQEANP